jgi:hypothetical protein
VCSGELVSLINATCNVGIILEAWDSMLWFNLCWFYFLAVQTQPGTQIKCQEVTELDSVYGICVLQLENPTQSPVHTVRNLCIQCVLIRVQFQTWINMELSVFRMAKVSCGINQTLYKAFLKVSLWVCLIMSYD